MEDLLALVDLFGLKVIGGTDVLSDFRGIPNITVEGSRYPVSIRCLRGRFYATDKIPDVPMRYVGNGSWQYRIEI